MTGRVSSTGPVLAGRAGRMRPGGADPSLPKDWLGQKEASVTDNAPRTVTKAAVPSGTKREGVARSALGPGPNLALQRIAAR
jgi:hypothetical protein